MRLLPSPGALLRHWHPHPTVPCRHRPPRPVPCCSTPPIPPGKPGHRPPRIDFPEDELIANYYRKHPEVGLAFVSPSIQHIFLATVQWAASATAAALAAAACRPAPTQPLAAPACRPALWHPLTSPTPAATRRTSLPLASHAQNPQPPLMPTHTHTRAGPPGATGPVQL